MPFSESVVKNSKELTLSAYKAVSEKTHKPALQGRNKGMNRKVRTLFCNEFLQAFTLLRNLKTSSIIPLLYCLASFTAPYSLAGITFLLF